MKKENAIFILQSIDNYLKRKNDYSERNHDAIMMAITALKEETICPILSDDEVKQPCIKSPCVIERPHGEWIFKHNSSDIWCSNCDENFNEIPQKFLFCPNCGAYMRVKDELNRVSKELNSEIEKSKSEIVPDYRDGWRLKEGDEK